ncbi:MAG: hypothetical protein J2P25_07685, partial [Nocardiopsaceae bacterium]|nr:hypothetical protein [Nocardiopsaceae bacterium]
TALPSGWDAIGHTAFAQAHRIRRRARRMGDNSKKRRRRGPFKGLPLPELLSLPELLTLAIDCGG